MKLKIKCLEFGISLTSIAKLTNVSRQTVSERINGKNNRYWNEFQMKKIWEYFKRFDNSIKITDLFF